MTDSAGESFHELGRRGHERLLEQGTGTVRFDLVDGRRTDRWLVTLDKGDVSVSRKNAPGDVAHDDRCANDRRRRSRDQRRS